MHILFSSVWGIFEPAAFNSLLLLLGLELKVINQGYS